MDPQLKSNLLNFETYKRMGFLLIFVLIYAIVETIIYATAIFQIFHLLFTGTTQLNVKHFAKKISAYWYDIVRFLTFDTDTMPFPFQTWDYAEKDETAPEEQPKAVKKTSKKLQAGSDDEMHA